MIRWPSSLGWWTSIHNEAPNQEVVDSIPAVCISRKVLIQGGNSNGFSFRTRLFTFYGHSTNSAPPAMLIILTEYK